MAVRSGLPVSRGTAQYVAPPTPATCTSHHHPRTHELRHMPVKSGYSSQQAKQRRRGSTTARAVSDPKSESGTSINNPLDAGPCGNLFTSSNSECWVRRTLLWGAVGVGLAIPVGVLWVGSTVRSHHSSVAGYRVCYAIMCLVGQ